ncbi:MAG: hypothetical protein GXZ11_00250 [Tissierellia bacterium]|nr:hypothetical protein [Tissierellia bacterium]
MKRKRVILNVYNYRLFVIWGLTAVLLVGSIFIYKNKSSQRPKEIPGDNYDSMRLPDRTLRWDKKASQLNLLIMRREEEEKRASLAMDLDNYFSDALFVGDSITEGLSYYKWLKPENVYATIGISLTSLLQKIDDIVQASPKRIYILMGTNDLENRKSVTDYIDEYRSLLTDIKEALPNTSLTIQSVMPMGERGYRTHPNITKERTDEYNSALKDLAQELEVTYLDLSTLFVDPKAFESDGIHLVYDFYGKWLNYIRTTEENRSDEDEGEVSNSYGVGNSYCYGI